MSRHFLLSIDGGGIRGIIPVLLLIKLEKETGKLTREIFDFVAGTSTGAIIAGALAAGIPAERILKIYTNRAYEIFQKSPFSILKRIFLGYMYPTERLYKVIKEELGQSKDITLNDLPIDILLPAKRVTDGIPFYFVKDNKGNSCSCGHLKLIDCVVASAAAPTYFHPWAIYQTLNSDKAPIGSLTDGGVGVAGNPVYLTCVEAFYYTDKYTPENTTIVSLGTGRFMEKTNPINIWDWLKWVLSELLSSPGEQQTDLVQRHFAKSHFYRLDPDLKKLDPNLKENIPLDGTEYIDTLRSLGEKFAEMVDWKEVLKEKAKEWEVNDQKTLWFQYSKP